jgi:hypothetical protein
MTCERKGNLFRACNWESQYDYEGPSEALAQQIEEQFSLVPWLAKLGVEKKTYVGSICTTCGKYIARTTIVSEV